MYYQTRNVMFGGGSVTPAIKFLLIANVAVFVLQTFTDYRMIRLFGLVPDLVLHNFYVWQLFTYQFLHGGLFHILFNMLALWMFGCDLERRWGTRFFLRYYFVSAIGGGILNTVFLPNQIVPSIGASAGIYGVLLAYGLIYPERIVYFYFLFPIKMKHFVMLIGAISLYSSIVASQSGIAHLAHLGGMGFGYVYLRWGNPWAWAKIYLDKYRLARRRRRFRVISGDKNDDSKPTLH
ncbi:MAG: rhomboid family intramembrane serine protease [Deltaproteobacteria bacterium]|nr:rhomboid family intramembrane serine protease [Deltaproteobacteria bacterium]